ncbi:MAG TPA: TonB-dependent receptor [Hellea balneolensis]|uniref:TonB-dependent receptor n=1 Tax=Hellea balneolensis TaxID=287478 RepID=A0A7C3C1Z4_9PROT|nr:TonB-dependent receptor [Hellea balneolensis]
MSISHTRALLLGCALLSVGQNLSFDAYAQSAQTSDDTHVIRDEIIVTGSPFRAKTSENLAGVSVLTSEELLQRMSGSLGETLKFEPGISSSFFGPGASRPVIRGQGGLRVLILDNGISSIDASSASPDHAAAVEPAMAERIEVIRGAGLLRYGSAASGGVINVIDGRIPDKVPANKISGAARVSASSVDRSFEQAAGVDMHVSKLGKGDVVAHVEISHRKTKDYDIPKFSRSQALRTQDPLPVGQEETDRLSNSATKATSVAGGISYIGEHAFIGGAIKDLNSTYGVPGGEGSTIRLDQTRFDANANWEFLDGPLESLNISGGVADYTHSEFEASGDVGTIFTNEGWEARVEIVQSEIGIWHGAHGVQLKKRDFAALGDEAFVPPTTTREFGLFSFHEFDFGDVHLEAAGRYEHTKHTNDTAGIVQSYDGYSLSAGLDYHIFANTKLGGTVFRTERSPTSEELFSNGPHLATNQFERSDITLGKEVARGVEASLRYTDGDNQLTLNGFYTDYQDYVFEANTGGIIILDGGDELPEFVFTPADAVFKGFELQGKKHMGTISGFDIHTDASLEYVKATISGTTTNILSNRLPRIPPLGYSFGLDADRDRWGFRAELSHAVRKDALADGELPSDSYTLVNAFAHYDINDVMSVRVAVMNIGDRDARQHTSFLKEVVPLPGRNFRISLEALF